MANPYQQKVFQRKLIYLGIVVALLAASWVWRHYRVEPAALRLNLLEESRGDTDLLGSAARTALSGLRGFVTCGLWMEAIEQQKKNQWNSLERTVTQLTHLQPHLITPWLFQSWNLAYNVSVESDRVADKYFYITRGVQLLARGERQNRNQPNLRREIGFYIQNKVCQSDETNVMRSLFQLSCIPPAERDPRNFLDEKGNVKLDALKEFCLAHPQLARRLHSPPLPYDLRREYRKFRCATAREVVQFLADNYNVPSLYVDRLEDEQLWRQKAVRSNPLERFPVLPPRYEEYADGTREARRMYNDEDLTEEQFVEKRVPDEVDGFVVAKAWYGYSQECIPPPGQLPGDSEEPKDRNRQRRPKHMSSVVFRTSPARAQAYVAERLQAEGWFDAEPFELTEWFKPSPSALDVPPKIGEREARPWSSDAWRKAGQMWHRFGVDNHLLISDDEFAVKKGHEEDFKKKFRITGPDSPFPDPAALTDEEREELRAVQFLRMYHQYRGITNLNHYLITTRVEEQERTVTARKLMYQAEQLRIVAQDFNQSLEKYEHPDSMLAWRRVLEDNPAFRRDSSIQEWTVDTELMYHRLYRRLNEDKLKPDLALLAGLGQAVAGPPLGADWTLAPLFSRPQLQPEIEIVGPFDVDSEGKPLIFDVARDTVLVRRGLKAAPTPGPGAPTPGPPGAAVTQPPQPKQ